MRLSKSARKAGKMRIKDRRIRKKRVGDKTPKVSFVMTLVMRIKLLFEMVLPESIRSHLAKSVTVEIKRSEAYENIKHPKAIEYYVRTVCRFLPIERNERVRRALLTAVRIVFWCRYEVKCSEKWMFLVLRAVHALLTRKDYVSDREREDALELLSEMHHEGDMPWDYDDDYDDEFCECCELGTNLCLEMIELHCTSKPLNGELQSQSHGKKLFADVIMERMTYLMTYSAVMDENTGAIIDNDFALPLLFDLISSPNSQLKYHASRMLQQVIVLSEEANRLTFIIRHFTRFDYAFVHMRAYDLVHLMEVPLFSHLISSSQALFCRISEDIRKQKEMWRYDYEHLCQLARLILEDAITDASRLEELLGYGFIVIARYFANPPSYGPQLASPHALFQRILTMYPQWQGFFKELTKDGGPTNQTAILGRGIIPRATRPPVDFIFLDEDCIDF